MYHQLEIRENLLADLRVPGRARLEQIMFRVGETIEAEVRSYIVEGDDGPMECADLYLGGGETLLQVPMEFFGFL